MKSVLYHVHNNNLPKHLPTVCRCGWMLLTNDNMTNIVCSNPSCIVQNSYKIDKALDILNINAGIADKTALEFINIFKLRSHMDIFGVDRINLESGIPSSINASYVKLVSEIERLREEGVTMFDFMDAFNLKDIGTTTSKLVFSNISNPVEFYKLFTESEEETLEEVHKRLCDYISDRIKISSTSDKVIGISRRLLLFKDEILRVANYFTFKNAFSTTYNIAITGQILHCVKDDGTKFKPRESFATYLSSKYGININVLGLSEKHVGILIMDEDMTGHGKFEKAMNSREKSGSRAIQVLTSKEFKDMIDAQYNI